MSKRDTDADSRRPFRGPPHCAGKTYLASVMTEEMVKAGLRVVVLDPLGAFWGLPAAADGTSDGLLVTILGGQQGDIPLKPTAGRAVAELVVAHPGSLVLDLSGFESNAAQDRFVADFAERLYRAKATDPRPIHLKIDEADSFAPQRPAARPAADGRRDRGHRPPRPHPGMGVTLITQRPAVINKNVLTQAECLVALQMTAGPTAIDEWVRGNGTKAERDRHCRLARRGATRAGVVLVAGLAADLQGGAGAHARALRLLEDAGGRRDRHRTATARTVDLEQLGQEMAETIERAKADDPKELKKRIADPEEPSAHPSRRSSV